ncbi:MAG TPA: OB-fold nucleic acid binding domain-containing protein, partial [Leptospiraceae bacterium]|nr:OB-fold nucleic acid binding domain-containing protein [Leptospiraceae bacterium]
MKDWVKESYSIRKWAGELGKEKAGETVFVCGWAFRFRDQGGVIFIDLRDRTGIIQVVARKENIPEDFKLAEHVRSEYVLAVKGKLNNRDAESINPKIPNGKIEVIIEKLEILNTSKTPPFALDEFDESGEDIRLKYRYLEFRKDELKNKMILRHKFIFAIRNYLNEKGFLEIETPILNKSTPEGARDFLVPSRLHQGYIYIPHNFSFDGKRRTAVSFKEFEKTLNSLAGKAVFFIDTCHSGNVLGEKKRSITRSNDPTGAINELLSAESGVVVFSASTGRQVALENNAWGNGAFTKALVEGISGKADYKNKGMVTHKML